MVSLQITDTSPTIINYHTTNYNSCIGKKYFITHRVQLTTSKQRYFYQDINLMLTRNRLIYTAKAILEQYDFEVFFVLG